MKQRLSLYKHAPRVGTHSAEWALIEIPGLILWKDTPPFQLDRDPDSPLRWHWHFHVVEPLQPELWPQGDCISWPSPSQIKDPHLHHKLSSLIQPLQDMLFNTRKDALQALEIILLQKEILDEKF